LRGDSCVGCLQGDKSGHTIYGKKFAITRADATAHSMGGVLLRWYTTDKLSQQTTVDRTIHYPTSTQATAAGSGYQSVQLSRTDHSDWFYRRPDNFRQGDLGSLALFGAPLRGSPFGNVLTHLWCHERRCYLDPVVTPAVDTISLPPIWPDYTVPLQIALSSTTEFAAAFATAINATPAARQQPDYGTAIYDLSIGSIGYSLFQQYDSEPVRVHAISTTVVGPDTSIMGQVIGGTAAAALDYVTHPDCFCPDFDASTSDLIVPRASQEANLEHVTPLLGVGWHNAQAQADKVQDKIGDLLVDSTGLSVDPLQQFDLLFHVDPAFPLVCNGSLPAVCVGLVPQ
jgi:hypothetical protein